MKRLAAIGAALLLIHGAAAAAPRCPSKVHVSLPNFEIAPYVLGTNQVENPPGLLIEWTRDALMLAGCPVSIVVKRLPPNRQLSELASGRIDVLPGFAFNSETGERLRFPMKDGSEDTGRAIMSNTISLYARAGDMRVQWDGKTLRSANPKVGSSTGGASTARIARAYGFELEAAPTPETDLRKLVAGRIDVIMEPDVVLGPLLEGADAQAVRRLEPPVHVTNRYAPVSARFAAAYPEFTERFWLELCRQARGARACK
jgi:hypothetical protein